MTVHCMDCGKVLREKCPACGAVTHARKERVEVIYGVFEWQDVFNCECGKAFRRGHGGISHGICKDCLSQRLSENTESTNQHRPSVA
jgi:hypothetical protein